MERFDINERKLKNGDIIDLHQTVNGQNLFTVITIEPLDIRYAHDITREYEYDKEELLAPSKFTNEIEWEIVHNLYYQTNIEEKRKFLFDWIRDLDEQALDKLISKYLE